MKELNLIQMEMVSGADGAPATVANAAGAGATLGAIAGIPGGPPGVLFGAAFGGLGVAIGSTVPSGYNPSGVSGYNSSGGSFFSFNHADWCGEDH